LVVPMHEKLQTKVQTLSLRLARQATRAIAAARMQMERATERLALRRVTQDRRQALDDLTARLRACHPRERLARRRTELERATTRLQARMQTLLQGRRLRLEAQMSKLDALSPLRVLERGYAIATRKDGLAIRSAAGVSVGDEVDVRLLIGS